MNGVGSTSGRTYNLLMTIEHPPPRREKVQSLSRPANPMTGGTVLANGVPLRYQLTGTGPVLLLIMGYRLGGHAWPQEFIDALARHFSVLVFDNRGTGQSGKPTHGYSMGNMAQDALALLNALGIPEVHVLGYSMGGAIAQEVAYAAPHRVTGLVLCNTWSGLSSSIYGEGLGFRLLRETWLHPHDAERRLWPITYSPAFLERNMEAVVAAWRREMEFPTPTHAAVLQFMGLSRFEMFSRLARVTAPSLVIAGLEDRLVPSANAPILARGIRGAELEFLPGVGHRAMWEMPAELADMIGRFLGVQSRT